MLTLYMDNIYLPSLEGDANVKTWHNVAAIAEGRKGIKPISQASSGILVDSV
jgi:hypothetical protein